MANRENYHDPMDLVFSPQFSDNKNLTFSEAFHEAGWARAGGWASYAHSLGNFIFHDMNIGDIKIIDIIYIESYDHMTPKLIQSNSII